MGQAVSSAGVVSVGCPVYLISNGRIVHILTRLHLLDNSRRKRQMDGVVYAIQRSTVTDMMRRYDVMSISNS